MEELSLKELQELRERGLVPRASKELVNSFDEIKNFIYRLYHQFSSISDDLQNVSYDTAWSYREIAYRLEELIAAGKNVDLNRPYSQDSLLQYRNLLNYFLDNDLYDFYRRGIATENDEHNIRQLNMMNDDFQRFTEKENQQNEELFRGLSRVDDEDVILRPEHRTKQNKIVDTQKMEQKEQQPIIPEEIKKEQKSQVPEVQKEKEEKTQQNKDVLQKPMDVMAREDVRQNKVKDKAPQKTEQNNHLENLNKQDVKKDVKQMGVGTVWALTDVLAKENYHDPNSFDNMWAVLRDASDKGLLSEEMKQEYRDIISWAREGHVPKQDAVQRLKRTILNQLDELDNTSLVQSQYKSIDAINKVKNFVSAYNEFNTTGDFGAAQYELDKLAKYIGGATREGLISEAVANDYRRVIRQTYGKNDEKQQKQAADELIKISDTHKNRIIYGQQFGSKESQKVETKKENQEKTQQNKDVLQKPADLRAPEDVKKDEKRQAVADFKSGTEKVLDLDKQIEQDKQKKLNQAALAAHRRKILLNRGNGNV